jgi:hypothetical protein
LWLVRQGIDRTIERSAMANGNAHTDYCTAYDTIGDTRHDTAATRTRVTTLTNVSAERRIILMYNDKAKRTERQSAHVGTTARSVRLRVYPYRATVWRQSARRVNRIKSESPRAASVPAPVREAENEACVGFPNSSDLKQKPF